METEAVNDFMVDGQAYGDVASTLHEAGGDPNAFRPIHSRSDNKVYTIVKNSKGQSELKVQRINNASTLFADQWKQIDDAIKTTNFPELVVVSDLSALSTYSLPNGMGTTVLEYTKEGDITDARQAMDPISEADHDRPQYDTGGLPIPVTFKDWFFTWREMEIFKSKPGAQVDTRQAILAKRKLDELNEKIVLGITTGVTYAGNTVYGYRNHPDTIVYSGLTLPTASGWTPQVFVSEVLDMQQELIDEDLDGPMMVYISKGWRKYLLQDWSAAKGVNTLMDRFRDIDGIVGIKAVSYLPNFEVIVVRWSPETARMVSGMETRVVQWPVHGGFGRRFKILNSKTPQIFSNYEGVTGIVRAVAS